MKNQVKFSQLLKIYLWSLSRFYAGKVIGNKNSRLSFGIKRFGKDEKTGHENALQKVGIAKGNIHALQKHLFATRNKYENDIKKFYKLFLQNTEGKNPLFKSDKNFQKILDFMYIRNFFTNENIW